MRYLLLILLLINLKTYSQSVQWWEHKYDKSQRVHFDTKSKDWATLESFCNHLTIKFDSIYIEAGKNKKRLWKSIYIQRTKETMYFIFEDNKKVYGLHYHIVEKDDLEDFKKFKK